MKTTQKFLIAGCISIPVCLILIITGLSGGNNTVNIILFLVGFFGIVPSIQLLIAGLRPYTTRIKSKIQSESIDYASEEIAEASNKTVDVTSTAIEKVAKIATNANELKTISCENCGAKLNEDTKFCGQCGKEINN